MSNQDALNTHTHTHTHAHTSSSSSSQRGGAGGLTSILPQPKQGSKIVVKSGPSTQAMIPHTLTKRPAQAPLKRRKAAVTKPTKPTNGQDSDSDGEPSSFFSHLEDLSAAPPPPPPPPPNRIAKQTAETSVEAAPSAPKPFSVEREEDRVSGDPSWLTGEYQWSAEAGEEGVVTDERFNPPPEPAKLQLSSMPGSGPGLSMDEQAVSWGRLLVMVTEGRCCSIAG